MLELKISNKTAKIAVIGLGTAGLFQSIELAIMGYSVTGVEISSEKVRLLREGKSYVNDIPTKIIHEVIHNSSFYPTSNPEALKDSDIILVSVPTDVTSDNIPDLSSIQSAIEMICVHNKCKSLIIIKSTGYPGMTEDYILPRLSKAKGEVGIEFYLSFSPERGDPGNRSFEASAGIPKVIGGVTSKCVDLTVALYEKGGHKTLKATSTKVAELNKLHENIFRFINISYVNEFANLCYGLNIDPFEVIELSSSKPYGFMPFYPGPGIGGMYLPVNPSYLLSTAKRLGIPSGILESAIVVNNNMHMSVLSRVNIILDQLKMTYSDARIVILGVGYKEDSNDTRNSPAIPLIKELDKRRAKITIIDPSINEIEVDGKVFLPHELNNNILSVSDVIIIMNNYSNLPVDKLMIYKNKIVDTKGILRKLSQVCSIK